MTGADELLALRPDGGFRCILADPPWRYATFSAKGRARCADRHYRVMAADEIAALPVQAAAHRDCHLFLWTSTPNLPQALKVMAAWGFRYSALAFCWVKLRPRENGAMFYAGRDSFHFGMGHTTRHNVELCLLGRRGRPGRLRKDVRELIVAPVREHSRKPDEAHERIEAYCTGPRLELFARARRNGWTAWGDETEKFGEAA